MDNYTEVLFDEMPGKGGNIGLMTLNRPEALNSLNHSMIHAMHAQLKIWASASHIKAVVIRAAEGRAFCAGGDLRLTYERCKTQDPALTHFFRDEYQLNKFIFHFPKPYIAFLDGITMGGGVGISIHGSHRVATDRLLFAMPETGIGFFPDVGGTYFLPRLPGKIGYYLALTGARIVSDDCVALGIAQHKVPQEKLTQLLDALAQQPFQSDARSSVTEIISQFQTKILESTLLKNQIAIDECFSANSVEEILELILNSSNIICKQAAPQIAKKSPISSKVTLRALHEGKVMDFDVCMRQEYRLASHFLRGHDFPEGIRAVIVDKDQNPHWQPGLLSAVTLEDVDSYFAPLTEELA